MQKHVWRDVRLALVIVTSLLVIRFVTDLTQKYVRWKKPIEGEALAPSPLWAFSTRHISV